MEGTSITTLTMFEPPLNVSFRSKVVDGKFFTLDGDKEISSPWYAKFITSYEDLTDLEINYVLLRYSNINHQLGELRKIIDTMKS